jgi:hypothetical protein
MDRQAGAVVIAEGEVIVIRREAVDWVEARPEDELEGGEFAWGAVVQVRRCDVDRYVNRAPSLRAAKAECGS